jgi:RimJ/RimL family protein N-acetyltransferase
VANDCGRFEWSVLDWNEPARRFYESLGAEAQGEWIIYRVSGDALRDLAVES